MMLLLSSLLCIIIIHYLLHYTHTLISVVLQNSYAAITRPTSTPLETIPDGLASSSSVRLSSSITSGASADTTIALKNFFGKTTSTNSVCSSSCSVGDSAGVSSGAFSTVTSSGAFSAVASSPM